MATFGASNIAAWSYFDTEATIPITASEGEAIYLVIFAFKPEPDNMGDFPTWSGDGPWTLPEGWVNVLDAEDMFAALVADELWWGPSRRAVFVYRYDGEGIPESVDLDIVYGGQFTFGVTFGVALEEGEQMLDFGFVAVEDPEPGQSIIMPGSAEIAGKRVVVVAELIASWAAA